jgi:precorrin-6A/cobalt-precorrin-6A reductase
MSRNESKGGPTVSTCLLVAGTPDAVRLADAIVDRFGGGVRVELVFVGVAAMPSNRRVTVSGIGLPSEDSALVAWTRTGDLVIDGLDPFDLPAIRRLTAATEAAGCPRLPFRSRMWERHPLDRWVEVRDLAGAVKAIPSVARIALLSLPRAQISAFEQVGGLRFPVRLPAAVPAPAWTLPPRFPQVLAPAPTSLARECHILRETKAQAVVMRATGALDDGILVAAARSFDLPVVMIRRPIDRKDRAARSITAALEWLEHAVKPGPRGSVSRETDRV